MDVIYRDQVVRDHCTVYNYYYFFQGSKESLIALDAFFYYSLSFSCFYANKSRKC